MSFSSEVVKDARGAVFKLDVSLDSFATVTYRYATHAGIDASADYEPLIVGLGNLTRGLGLDHTFQTASIDLALDNTGELVDWMVDLDTATDMLKARWRLYIGLFDPTAAEPYTGIQWLQLGEFIAGDHPRRTVDRVTIQLVDQTAGFLHGVVERPSLSAWIEADNDASTNPLAGYGVIGGTAAQLDLDSPIALAFGDDYMPATRCTSTAVESGSFDGQVPLIVCATASTAVLTANDVQELWAEGVQYFNNGQPTIKDLVQVPETVLDPTTGSTLTIWAAHKSETITVDSRDFKVLWIGIDLIAYCVWYASLNTSTFPSGQAIWVQPEFKQMVLETQMQKFWVKGYPFSAVTITSQATQHPADILTDLITYYSSGSAADLDTGSIATVKGSFKSLSAAGRIGSGDDPGSPPSLADTLAALAGSFDLDVLITWAGQVGLASSNRDYDSLVSVLPEIDETRVADFEDTIPSRELRGAPFNRLVLRDVPKRLLFADGAPDHEGSYQDDPANTQRSTDWNRVLTREISIPWLREEDALIGFLWFTLSLNATVRPRVRFTTDLEALLLDLGDFFKLTYTRNLGDPYNANIFQIYSLTLNTQDLTVEVEALWADDPARPYILDSEALLMVVASSAGRTVTVQNGNSHLVVSSGDLIADGVQEGDHLILKDSTEAATSFYRNKALKIASVDDATHLTVADPLDGYDFDAPVGAAVADWEIRRSHLTYPTVASDPVNYPDGGNVYGRVSSNDSGTGTYSGNGTGGFTDGHQLLDG